MMKLIRAALGKVILTLDSTFAPQPLQREPAEQAEIDKATSDFILYQFEACPFCVKVRRAIRRLNLNIELRNAARVPEFADELVKGGGQLQVPCLRMGDRWMYESSEIIAYLESRFGEKAKNAAA